MLRPRPRLRLRQVDAAYQRAIAEGPLWSYNPSSHPDQLGTLRDGPAYGALSEIEAVAAIERFATSPHGPIDGVVVDGRCLQHPDFADRGIGRYTASFLGSLQDSLAGIAVTVVLDEALPPLKPHALAEGIATTYDDKVESGSVLFLDPAPMTHGPSILDRHFPHGQGRRAAIVYDFIPANAPNIYFPRAADQAAYHERLQRLSTFDTLLCISESVAHECRGRVDLEPSRIHVLPLPDETPSTDPVPVAGLPTQFIFAPLGADRRKNLPCAVSVLAALSHLGWDGHLVILSHMPDEHRRELDALATACQLDPARVHAVAALSDNEVAWLYERSMAVVMPSFAEGLSLPVIEAVDAGRPVAASDIPPHRELLGPTAELCDARRPSTFARQLKALLDDPAPAVRRQQASLASARARRSFDATAQLLLG